MKTIKKISLLLLLASALNSCVKDGSFKLPDTSIKEPEITATTSLLKIKAALQQAFISNNKLSYTFPIDEEHPSYAEAYVISSDATGNFYKQLIIQDAPEQPKAGLQILLNASSLSNKYQIGQKIFIKLDGLTVSYDDGAAVPNPTNQAPGNYSLGYLDGDRATEIPSTAIKDHLFKTNTITEIVPQTIIIKEINDLQINTYVRLENAQFDPADLGKTFSGEPNDEYDGFRYLFECGSDQLLRLQSSTFASFKSAIIPNGKGSINCILTKDFTSSFLVTIINTPSDIAFEDSQRCDPDFLNCETKPEATDKTLYFETFENLTKATELIAAGWSNINVNGGEKLFSSKTKNGNRALEISAYNSNESPLEVWMISPGILLDNTNYEVLTFDTNTGYDNGKALQVFVSTDFTGDVKKTTWIPINAKLSEGPSNAYSIFYTASGKINLSCLSGTVHVAFRYLGGDGTITTTVQIDNVKITGK